MNNKKALEQFKEWEESGWSKSETPNSAALVIAMKAIEKADEKNAEYHHKAYGQCALTICPRCDNRVTVTKFGFPLDRYCKECGQHYVVNIKNWEVEE